MSRVLSALVVGALMGVCGLAQAETIERTVKANTRTAVGGFFTYRESNCGSAGIPEVKIKQNPAHGTVTVQEHKQALGKNTRCPGMPVVGSAFVYTPAKGFKGSDEFAINIPFAREESSIPMIYTHTYKITVE